MVGMMCNTREERGKEIAGLDGQIKRLDEHTYKVKSQSARRFYDVINTEIGWTCSCPDHTFRKMKCKHIHAAEFSIALRKKVQESVVINEVSALACICCGSDRIVKNAVRPHEGLNGRTPADLCGIKVEGKNKWLTLIQNASESTLKG